MLANDAKLREVINQMVKDPAYKKVSSIPLISFHQVSLILFSYVTVVGGILLYLFYHVPLWVLYPLMILGIFTAFTPLHEATHRSLSSNKFLNDFLGTIAGILLVPFVNTKGYRYVHMTHHRYTGDKTLDPDDPLVHIPTRYFPLGYLIFFVADYTWAYWLYFKVWKRTPLISKINISFILFANLLFNVLFFMSPYWYEYLILYFIPNRLGLAYLAFSFAHIQHPDGVKWHEHPFQATNLIKGNFLYLKSLLGQADHALHHFMPHVPWYNYGKAMKLANGVAYKQSIPERHAFVRPRSYPKEKLLEKKTDEHLYLQLKVSQVMDVAAGIKSFVFEAPNGEVLPEFTAGAHINVTLPSGKVRAYSLINPTYDNRRYQIAVKLEKNGKGGSKEMHENVKEGDQLTISIPRNNFVLYENTQKYILISGGIGITPLLSMAHRLIDIDKHFEFHICARNQEEIAFGTELRTFAYAPNIEVHLDKNGKSSINLSNILASPDKDTLIYVCGPVGFNKWVKNTALNLGWDSVQIKQEVFSVNDSEWADTKPFELVLNKSGKTIKVDKNLSAIDALLLNNIKVAYTCLQGTCGTCITNVIAGDVDHRDAVLSEEEKLENKKICLCVSRAKEGKLVVDL